MAMRMPLTIAILIFGASNSSMGVRASASVDISTRNRSFDVSSTMPSNFPFKQHRRRLKDFHFRSKSLRNIPNQHISQQCNDMHRPKLEFDKIPTHRAGAQSTKMHSSTILFILNQTINSITAAAVGSGFLGSWIASFVICKLHELASSFTLNETAAAARASRGPLFSVFMRKWTLTVLSCGVYFLLNRRKIIRAIWARNAFDSLIGFGEVGILLVLCLFSSTVDPLLGGFIGSSYVSLDMIAYLLGRRNFGNPPSDLMKFRMKPLVDGTEFVGDDNAIPQKRSPIRESLANAILSLPLLASRPQYFLSLYLLAGTIVTWIAKTEHAWCTDFMSWLKVGSMNSMNAENIGGDVLEPWSLSLRLYVLNLIVMTVKAVMAFVLL
ncbi:hypothetical protein ACHAW6_008054 [Cyclotella cf. meneghiniana]